MNSSVFLLLLTVLIGYACAFNLKSSARLATRNVGKISMEYVPDGMSKEQWQALKKKEAEANKGKDLGKIGITKFQSRSLEAWQKTGGKHLFPVDPTTGLAERPYMQRKGGVADGTDLKAKGIVPKGQAVGIATDIDKKYEKLEKEGKLRSSPFTVPWTSAQAADIEKKRREELAKTLAASRKNFQGSKTKVEVEEPIPEPRKKLFGFF